MKTSKLTQVLTRYLKPTLTGLLLICVAGLAQPGAGAGEVPNGKRLLSLGGSLTEIIYELGQQDRLVGRDRTSNYPEAALELPDVGYVRRLSPEGVLSVQPDMIIAEDGAGPMETIEVLEEANIEFVRIPMGYDRAAVRAKIEAVAAALDMPEEGAALADRVDAELAAAAERAAERADGTSRRVLFVISTRGGRVMAGGTDTAADGIIRLAGGINVASDFSGFKQMSDEAVLAAAPDVILMMDHDHFTPSSDDELLAMPALSTTPASANRAVVRLDGMMMLGFGPRTAQGITEVNRALFGADE